MPVLCVCWLGSLWLSRVRTSGTLSLFSSYPPVSASGWGMPLLLTGQQSGPSCGTLSALSHSLCSVRVTCSNSDIARRNLKQVVCRCSLGRGSAPACYWVFIYLCACGKTSCARKTSFSAECKSETSNEATVTKQYSSLLSTDRNLSTCYQTQTAMNDVHIHQYSIWKIDSVLFSLLFVNFLKCVKNGIQFILQFAHS